MRRSLQALPFSSWLVSPSPRASQEHLDGILDRGQHEAYVRFLEALEQKSIAKIISRQRAVTPSGMRREFLVEFEYASAVPAGLGSVGVQFETFSRTVRCVPTALNDGRILLETEVEIPGQAVPIAGKTVSECLKEAAVRLKQRPVVLEADQSLVLGGHEWILLVTPKLVGKESAEPTTDRNTSVSDQPKADLTALHAAVRALVLKHYPKADVTLQGNKIRFSFNTRKFMIHEPLLTGEWQDAWEVIGPQKGGILGYVELRPGRWEGHACRPSASDKRYFTELWMAPQSARHGCYLDVVLSYPHDAPEDFLADFRRLVDGFDAYLTPTHK
jgi:hypothetical protein